MKTTDLAPEAKLLLFSLTVEDTAGIDATQGFSLWRESNDPEEKRVPQSGHTKERDIMIFNIIIKR